MTTPERREDRPAAPERVETGRAAPAPVAGGVALLVAVVGAALISVLLASLDETYEAVQEGDGLARIDHPLLDWMVAHRSPGLDQWVTWFTNVGGTVILAPLVLVVVVALSWWWHSWSPVVLMAVATAGSVVMTNVGKDVTARARPPQSLAVPPFETSPSFPSGHTLNSTVIAIVLVYLVTIHVHSRVGRTVTIVLLILYAAAMGMSRVFLGHHWFTDVVAGWLAGAAWAAVVILAHRTLLYLQGRRRAATTGPTRIPDPEVPRG